VFPNLKRLLFERDEMARIHPWFTLYRRGDDYYFRGWYISTTLNSPFELKLDIPPYYPHQLPALYIISPITLWKYDGSTINSEGVSHAFHTLQNGPNGCVQICHFNSETWDASKNCPGVAYKAMLWVEAYGVHVATGMSIASILEKWKRRQAATSITDILEEWERK
jgi:hypothetical protein